MMEASIYISLIGLVIITYAWLIPKSSARKMNSKPLKQLEDTIDSFAASMDEENQMMINFIKEIQHDMTQKEKLAQLQISSLEQQLHYLQSSIQDLKTRLDAGMAERQNTIPASPVHSVLEPGREEISPEIQAVEQKLRIKERYTDIFNLYDDGKSIEYIAKKLGMNKGEVMLIIQLSKQEDPTRV